MTSNLLAVLSRQEKCLLQADLLTANAYVAAWFILVANHEPLPQIMVHIQFAKAIFVHKGLLILAWEEPASYHKYSDGFGSCRMFPTFRLVVGIKNCSRTNTFWCADPVVGQIRPFICHSSTRNLLIHMPACDLSLWNSMYST